VNGRAVTDVVGRRAAGRALAGVAGLAVVLIVVACTGGPAQSAGASTTGPLNGGGSPGPGGDWRSWSVCQFMPGEEAAALLGVTAGTAAPADSSSPSSCQYTFNGGAGPAELTISLEDAAAFAARYDAATDALDASDDVELREFFGLFDEAFATSTPEEGVEIWVRKGEVAAVFRTPGTVDDHKTQLIALARALLGKV
jgi:hypothetical protein